MGRGSRFVGEEGFPLCEREGDVRDGDGEMGMGRGMVSGEGYLPSSTGTLRKLRVPVFDSVTAPISRSGIFPVTDVFSRLESPVRESHP